VSPRSSSLPLASNFTPSRRRSVQVYEFTLNPGTRPPNMSYHAASLTPSRPAPQAPQRRLDAAPAYGSNSTLAALGYSSSFKILPASPSGTSYAFPYSGIGGSPIRGQDLATDSQVVRLGWVSMKDDSFGFGNWIFQRKWLVLKENSLSIHKNEVGGRKYLWMLCPRLLNFCTLCMF
jgi:hypothetical protein